MRFDDIDRNCNVALACVEMGRQIRVSSTKFGPVSANATTKQVYVRRDLRSRAGIKGEIRLQARHQQSMSPMDNVGARWRKAKLCKAPSRPETRMPETNAYETHTTSA